MLSNKKVQILMSTYNGERYLKEQLDSIFAQTYPNIEVLVRDDGSKDGTREILREYQKTHPNLFVYEEKNEGLTKSFLELIQKCDADYVSFSDQDDYWLENKIEVAVEKLENIKGPALYCSNQILVDKDLIRLPEGVIPDKTPGFGNALIESMCTGCTAVMNRELINEVKGHLPKNAIWHDWWCYLVASYLGTVVFDKGAYILYRQHGDNQLGSSRSTLVMIKNKWNFLRKTRGMLGKQIANFKEEYRGNKEKDELVDLLLASKTSFPARIKLVFNRKLYRQRPLDNLVVKFLYLFNRML